MEKITFSDKHGQQIYNIHATLKVTFDVDAVVAQLLEDNRGVLPGDIELSVDDVVESVRGSIEHMAYMSEHMTITERIADNNGMVY